MPSTPPARPAQPVRVVLVVGVAGAGKTTVGTALAARLGWAFADADDFHDAAALATMARGVGLTDAGRAPWLARLAALVRTHLADGRGLVLACSALRTSYRETLTGGDARVSVVWLDAPADVLAERLAARRGHAVGPILLPSQLATLEPPADALRLDATRPVEALVAEAVRAVGGDADGPGTSGGLQP